MSANKVESVPTLTFVSMSGPLLDKANAKAMRAHTTKANFARRRQRRVLEHATKRRFDNHCDLLAAEENGKRMDRKRAVQIQLPISTNPGFGRKLNAKDTVLMDHLIQAIGRLQLLTNIPAPNLAMTQSKSDWTRLLSDPTMLDVSLHFARHFYAARLQRHAAEFFVDAYRGSAIRSVREHLNAGVSDSLIAAILILSVLDQTLGNVESWKIHISGLLQITAIRSRNSCEPSAHWTVHAVARTIFQGLLIFGRHDVKLIATIEKTGAFDRLFSASAKRTAYLILGNTQRIATLQNTYIRDKQLVVGEQSRIRRIMASLDIAIELNGTSHPTESYLTGIALSTNIFLEFLLGAASNTESDAGNTALQLMEVLQWPGQQPCSSLALCSSSESAFWQTMMGAIAAPDTQTRSWYTSRLRAISSALALTSWRDALGILQKFFWIPSIFSASGYQILFESWYSQGLIDV